MELALLRETVKYYDTVYEERKSAELLTEYAIREDAPGALRVLGVYASVCELTKSVSPGKVSLGGTLLSRVLYAPENGGSPEKAEIRTPFAVTGEGRELRYESLLTSDVRICEAEGRLSGNRKLILKFGLCADLTAYNERETAFAADASERERWGVEVRKSTRRIKLPCAVKSKSFSVNDEPEWDSDGGEILLCEAEARLAEMKPVAGKVIFRGEADVRLVSAREGQGLALTRCTVPFSQTLEMDGCGDNSDCTLKLRVDSAEAVRNTMLGGGGLALLVGITAEAVATVERELETVEDIYSTRYELTAERESVSVAAREAADSLQVSCREQPEAPADVSRVVDVRFLISRPVCMPGETGSSVRAQVCAAVLYRDADGLLRSFNHRFEALGETPETGEMSVEGRVHSGSCEESDGGAVIRCEVVFDCFRPAAAAMSNLLSVEVGAEKQRGENDPSIVLRYIDRGESFWELAKRYNTSTAAIFAANGLEASESSEREQMLLIPRG